MNKRFLLFSCILIMLFFNGCQLAKPDADTSPKEDRLVGLYLTLEPIDFPFDEDAFLEDHSDEVLRGEEIVLDEMSADKLYGELIENTYVDETGTERTEYDYQFPISGGYKFIHYVVHPSDIETVIFETSSVDDIFANPRVHASTTDEGYEHIYEATVNLEAGFGEFSYFVSPVFQTANDEIYLIPNQYGQYTQTIYDYLGNLASYSWSIDSTIFEDGKELSESTTCILQLEIVKPADEITFIEMDSEHQEICRNTFVPGELPGEYTPTVNTSYILTEEYSDGIVSRNIYQDDSDEITTFYGLGNGICIYDSAKICW